MTRKDLPAFLLITNLAVWWVVLMAIDAGYLVGTQRGNWSCESYRQVGLSTVGC